MITREADPVETMDSTIAIMETAKALLAKIGRERIEAMLAEGTPARTFEQLIGSLL